MNKKKMIVIIVAIVAIVLAASLIFTFSQKSEDSIINSMESGLHAMLDTMEGSSAEQPAFLAEVDQLNGYEVLSCKKSETAYIATVRVYAPDLYSIAKKLDSDGITRTEEEMLEAISSEVKSATIIEKTLEVEFTETDSGYFPVLTAEFLDALYGGVFRLYDDILSGK